MNKEFTNKEIIEMLGGHAKKKNEALNFLYKKVRQALKGIIFKDSGNTSDLDEIVQDAIIAFYENIVVSGIELKGEAVGYICQVGKYMWYKRNGKKTQNSFSIDTIPDESFVVPPEDLLDSNVESFQLIEKLMNGMGRICKQILIQSFYEKKPMDQIAENSGLKNAQNARNKKYKCLKKLRELAEASGHFSNMKN